MTRITPRTCLYPLTAALLITFGLSVGLTFRSDHYCYASVCGEWLFPLQARLHVVVWYFWLSISVTVLAVRAFSFELRRWLRIPLFKRKIPLLGKQLCISGAILVLWIVSLYGILIGIWWLRLQTYFKTRGQEGGVLSGNNVLAAIAQTGHLADVTMGMVLLPISRHSALSSFFKISVSTTLAFHMVMAYTLFIWVLIHGFLYVSWIPVFNSLSSTLRNVFPVLNPTYLYNEVWPGNTSSLGVWRASLIFSGSTTAFVMLILAITTIPKVRSKHFNVFYFTHLLSIVAVLVICLHASTMFYCVAPGLAMWLLDWGMRVYELGEKLDGKLRSLGNGWYSLGVELPIRRLDGCACDSPLAQFYIYHSDTSVRELHPFSTTTHLRALLASKSEHATTIPIEFLFRKVSTPAPIPSPLDMRPKARCCPYILPAVRDRSKPIQWTDRFAGLVDAKIRENALKQAYFKAHTSSSTASSPTSPALSLEKVHSLITEQSPIILETAIRLEGPYFTPAVPARFHHVICLVAGTGVSGAISIASAFHAAAAEQQQPPCKHQDCACTAAAACCGLPTPPTWQRCTVVWTVREDHFVELPQLAASAAGLQTQVFLSGRGRPRLDLDAVLASLVRAEEEAARTWVYISGPNGFIEAAETACKRVPGLQYYGARWDI